ncbi:MAG: leucine-rich repeat domain-containing protein [Clostridia bacterium]
MNLIPFNVFSTTNGDSFALPENIDSTVSIRENIVTVKVGDNDFDFINFDKSTQTVLSSHDHIITANIPAKIEDIDVLYIAEMAFYCKENLTSAVLPNSILEIGNLAFASCPRLFQVFLPNYLEKINEMTFYSCYNLKYVALPQNLTTIENGAFSFCYSLDHINIPKTIKNIESNVFLSCDNLKQIHYEGSRKSWKNLNYTTLDTSIYYYMPMPELAYNKLSSNSYIFINETRLQATFFVVDDSVYFKLSDIAVLLKDTQSFFEIQYYKDRQVTYIHKNEAYTPSENELFLDFEKHHIATPTFSKICLESDIFYLNGYTIDNFIYYNLFDLSEILDFRIEKNNFYNIYTNE